MKKNYKYLLISENMLVKENDFQEILSNNDILEILMILNFEKSDEIHEEIKDLLQKLYESLQLKTK